MTSCSSAAAGIAFTPGGLRLASRAAELLGLQDRTVIEVSEAAAGRRLLRVAASSLFAEHCAPGLLELFAGRAADLDVELRVHHSREFSQLLLSRAIDVAVGPEPGNVDDAVASGPLLNYQVVVVAASADPLTRIANPSVSELHERMWLLGPAAASPDGLMASMLRRLNVPESRLQIFQSGAAALEEVKRGGGVTLALQFAVSRDLANGDLARVGGANLSVQGRWHVLTRGDRDPAGTAAEFTRFAASPRATQAMLRGSGVTVGRFRPSIHVTLWS